MSSISWEETSLMAWKVSSARGYIAAPFCLLFGYLVLTIFEIVKDKSWVSPDSEKPTSEFVQPQDHGQGQGGQAYGNPQSGNKYEIGGGGSDDGHQEKFGEPSDGSDKQISGNLEFSSKGQSEFEKSNSEAPNHEDKVSHNQNYEPWAGEAKKVEEPSNKLTLREEIWNEIMYFMIVTGWLSMTWHSVFPMLLIWINFCLFVVWIILKIMENPKERFLVWSMYGVYIFLMICAMVQTNTS